MLLTRGLLAGLLIVGIAGPVQAQFSWGPPPEKNGILVPYEPTPDNVVEAMLKIGNIGANDVVMDLGSGDGRIVITAAREYGARAIGVELNPDLVNRSLTNAKTAGVSDRVEFRQEDIFKTDLTPATVVTMFLYPRVNIMLRPKLLELKPGTRIVSHFHDMQEWRPDNRQRLMTKEHYGDTWVFLWYIPAKVEGRWQWTQSRGGVEQRHVLSLRQTFQEIEGELTTDSLRPIAIRDAKLRGPRISFWVPIRESGRTVRWDFNADVEDGVIVGSEVSQDTGGRKQLAWRAERVPR